MLWDKTSWPLIICSMREKHMRCAKESLHGEENRRDRGLPSDRFGGYKKIKNTQHTRRAKD